MLLRPEEEKALAEKLVAHAREILSANGEVQVDQDTGFEHLEYRSVSFILIEHQRQKVRGGAVKTNGLDIWWLSSEPKAKRVFSVNYLPFRVKVFHKHGKAAWIEDFLALNT